jgi:hypothetical protein
MFSCPATSLTSRFGRRRGQPTPIGDAIAEFSAEAANPGGAPDNANVKANVRVKS